MTDVDFIAREQSKLDARLLRQLRKIARTGFVGPKWALETLLVNSLVAFGPPHGHLSYNHYRLTNQGLTKLTELEGRAA